MDSTAYSPLQVMFTLSRIAELGDTDLGSNAAVERRLAAQVKQALASVAPLGGAWELAWGPTVAKFHGALYDDNMMYVARDTAGPNRVAIVIRGTNPKALLDWLFEDLHVSRPVPWPYAPSDPAAPKLVSPATMTGLNILQTMRPCLGVPGEGRDLLTFLKEQVASAPALEIVVTGHSLGGALASTLALWLVDTRGDASPADARWDPDGRAQVSAITFAGPTAGNVHFAAYTDLRLAGRCTRVVNSLDVVPHAWNTATMDQIRDLYAPHAEPGLVERGALDVAIAAVRSDLYTQVGTTTLLTSAFNAQHASFAAQAGYQHSDGYLDLLGLSSVDAALA